MKIKLTYLGVPLDTSKEHELFSNNEHGFTVTVKYTMESWMSQHKGEQEVDVFNNCTEVHFMYESFNGERKRCAFESDIHKTGGNREINEIESITIELASEKAKNW